MIDNIPYIEDYKFEQRTLPRSKMDLYYDKLSFECLVRGFGEYERSSYIFSGFLSAFGDSPYVRDFLKRNLGKQRNLYRIRHDGGHHTGTLIHPPKKTGNKKSLKTDKEEVFDSLFIDSLEIYKYCKHNKKQEKQRYFYLYRCLTDTFGEFEGIHDFLEKNIKRLLKRFHDRSRRFIDKFNLNEWNYFVTVTYDSKKFPDEEEFRRRLKGSLSHFHTRYGWKYMGAFERAPDTGRLHFHAVMFIPEGAIRGRLYKKTDYSIRERRMKTIVSNTFFDRFGRNEFEYLSKSELNGCGKYVIKYIGKNDESIFYSRGVPCFIISNLDEQAEIAGYSEDYIPKALIYDFVFGTRDFLEYDDDEKHNFRMLC